jgi:hypothetical protein
MEVATSTAASALFCNRRNPASHAAMQIWCILPINFAACAQGATRPMPVVTTHIRKHHQSIKAFRLAQFSIHEYSLLAICCTSRGMPAGVRWLYKFDNGEVTPTITGLSEMRADK